MEETNQISLADGRKIVLDDEDDVLLHLIAGDKTLMTYTAPDHSGGYGGGRLLLAPSQRLLIFAYYSGESEEGLLLLAITDHALALLYDSDYIYGEDAHYCFSPDETTLYQALRTGSYYPDTVQTDDEGKSFYPFGTLGVIDISSKTRSDHPVIVYPAAHWEEEITDDGEFAIIGCDADTLHLSLPWGEAVVPLPLAASVRLWG